MNQHNARRAFAPVAGRPAAEKRARCTEKTPEITVCGKKAYVQYIKRFFDVIMSAIALVALSPLIATIALLIRWRLGSPVIFKQTRPGRIDQSGRERLFTLYKFRSMTDARDQNNKLLSDEERLTWFGDLLRRTSMDELPELWNIIKGDMSVIGPRPLLVRDMVFMTDEQRKRHLVRPGLSGLAQISGRNCIRWEDKLDYDLQYIRNITFWKDLKIILITILKVFKTESISFEGMATAEDLGDYLRRSGTISEEQYNKRQQDALSLLEGDRTCRRN